MRYVRPKTYTPDDVALVRKWNRKKTAEQIAKIIGCPLWKIYHIRKKEGISAIRDMTWTAPRKAKAFDLYIRQGRPSDEVGKALGCSGKAIRKLTFKEGWKRDNDQIRKTNAANGVRAWAAANRPAKHVYRPPPKPVQLKAIAASDKDLIEDFLATRGATVLPTMHARGVTVIEQRFWASTGEGGSGWRKAG